MFSSLVTRVPGAHVLDLFAGSGALGLEAWSRGAERVCWVEKDRSVFSCLKANIAQMGCEEAVGVECVLSDAWAFLKRRAGAQPFHLVFADPPYDRMGEKRQLEKTLKALEEGALLAVDGLLVYEQNRREPPVEQEGWVLIRDKTYGESRVLIYRR